MNDVTITVRQGQSAGVMLQLLEADGTPHSIVGAPRIELVLAANEGQGASYVFSTTDTPAKLTVSDAPQGKLSFVPDRLKVEESPYRGYIRRYYSADTWGPWPSDGDVVFQVLPPYV